MFSSFLESTTNFLSNHKKKFILIGAVGLVGYTAFNLYNSLSKEFSTIKSNISGGNMTTNNHMLQEFQEFNTEEERKQKICFFFFYLNFFFFINFFFF